MKASQQCPKCSSTQIVMLGGVTFNTKVYPYGLDDSGYSMVGRYACTECGYVEEYLANPQELANLRQGLG